MRKIIMSAVLAIAFIASTSVMAQDKKECTKAKTECCKKDAKKECSKDAKKECTKGEKKECSKKAKK